MACRTFLYIASEMILDQPCDGANPNVRIWWFKSVQENCTDQFGFVFNLFGFWICFPGEIVAFQWGLSVCHHFRGPTRSNWEFKPRIKLFLDISVLNYKLNAFVFFFRAMEFLNQCELLKIEDILPFFQDFVTIDHFKVRLAALALL